MRHWIRFAFVVLLSWSETLASPAQTADISVQSEPKPDIVLRGEITGTQNHTYVEVPFNVPPRMRRVTLTFSYTEKQQHTALDLGLLDPVQLRCWSGGNKSLLTVGVADATPSCLPGPVPAGTWKVLIGVPNIRPQVRSSYTVQVFFTRSGLTADEPAMLCAPLRIGPAWYRGDLHMHTAHSDGQCASQAGKSVPCPVFFTADTAARRGLDFIAITDHNAMSHYDAMRELQPYFDKLLLIPGREITTFQGHLNLLGTTQFLDFRIGSKNVPDMNALLQNARKLGALVSINHPRAPTGEICMGCGWTPSMPVDMSLLTGVEVVNGGDMQRPATAFWDEQIARGNHLTAIGGSDNHNSLVSPERAGAVGRPLTVVEASELSVPALLNAIRNGRVFVDLTSSHDKILDIKAESGSDSTQMGGEIHSSAGQPIQLHIRIRGCAGDQVHLLLDGKEQEAPLPISDADQTIETSMPGDGQRHWLRAEVRDSSGTLLLIGNPIYINFPESQETR
jgi:hypothetical protein